VVVMASWLQRRYWGQTIGTRSKLRDSGRSNMIFEVTLKNNDKARFPARNWGDAVYEAKDRGLDIVAIRIVSEIPPNPIGCGGNS